MDYYHYSLIFMGVGIVIGVGVFVLLCPDEQAQAGAIVAGVVTALADFVLAAIGHRLDLWHLRGAFEVLSVPLSLSVAWVTLTMALVLVYDRLGSLAARLGLLAGGAVGGALLDHYVFRPSGIVRWGQLHPAAITPYWLAMVGLAVATRAFVLRVIRPPAESSAPAAVRAEQAAWKPTAEVSLARCEGYDPEEVLAAMGRLLEPLGGMSRFVPQGASVLLKPNYLTFKPTDKAVCTDPVVTWAAAKLCLEAGASRVLVGDSPAMGTSKGISKKLGLTAMLADLPVEIVDFDEPVEVKAGREGAVFKTYLIARQLREVDVVINLAKAKTHAQMYLTLAVKNCFGAVVGLRKSQWHMMAGRDYDIFGRMLVDLYELVAPKLSIVDGVLGMEGNGPSGGTPRQLDFLAASADGHALDRVVTELLGFDPRHVPTLRVVGAVGPVEEIPLRGEPLAGFAVRDFEPSRLARADWAGFIGRFTRNAVTPRPLIDHAACTRCKQCAKHCPPQVMKLAPRPRRIPAGPKAHAEWMDIELEGCIRCFCCQEVCPEEAITVREGWMHRLRLVR